MKKNYLYLLVLSLSAAIFLNFFQRPPKPLVTELSTEVSNSAVLSSAANMLPMPTVTAMKTDMETASLSELVETAFTKNDPAWAWDKVDMKVLKQQLPDNLYWDMSIPTDDELVLEQRDETRKNWRKQHGKIVAATASEQEVNDYYDYQQRLSSDYVEFANTMLEAHQSHLPERDVRLVQLVSSMHSTRLNEYPLAREQALLRHADRARDRLEWLADKSAYEARLRKQLN